MAKKGYNYPIKKKIPLILLLNLFGILIIHFFRMYSSYFLEIYKKFTAGETPPAAAKLSGKGHDPGALKGNVQLKHLPVGLGDGGKLFLQLLPQRFV